MRRLLLFAAIAGQLASCNNNTGSDQPKEDVLAANMDTTTDLSQDFFLYANGGWIKKNQIPADQGSWGIGNLVIEENLKRLRSISEKADSADAPKGSNEQKIGDFWATAMDSGRIEQQGLQPLQPYLDKINNIKDVSSLIATSAEFKRIGSGTLFSDFVTQDDKNSEVVTYKLWQGGLGLPEREYYFKTDTATAQIRNQYKEYITKMLTLSGEDSVKAAKAANNILALETKLAKASRKLEDLRNPYENYNKMAVADLPKLSPVIDWKNHLKITGVQNIDSVIVGQPEFFKALNNERL
jgi:putative endopeptidase